MRFLIIRKADAQTEAGALPDEALISAMGRYNETLVKAGVMLDSVGLRPSARGARIDFHDGRPTVTDGPFGDAKELVAGYTLIQAKSREEALEWVKRWPAIDGGGQVQLELRQVHELEDFGHSAALDRMRELSAQLPSSSRH